MRVMSGFSLCITSCCFLYRNVVNHGKNLSFTEKSKISKIICEGLWWGVPVYVRPQNTTTVKFCKSYSNSEYSYSLCPPNNKAMESFNLTGCCLYLYLTKHNSRTFVVKTQTLEETNHLAGVGLEVLSSLQLKHRGSQQCHFLSLPWVRGGGGVSCSLDLMSHTMKEREKSGGGFSLFQHWCFIRNSHMFKHYILLNVQQRT